MYMIKWLSKNLKDMNVWDIQLLKAGALLIGVILGAYYSAFCLEYMKVIVVVLVVIGVKLGIQLFKNRP